MFLRLSGNSRENDCNGNYVDIAVNVDIIFFPMILWFYEKNNIANVIQTHHIFKKHSSVMLSIPMKKLDGVIFSFSTVCQTECLTSNTNFIPHFTTIVNRPQNWVCRENSRWICPQFLPIQSGIILSYVLSFLAVELLDFMQPPELPKEP